MSYIKEVKKKMRAELKAEGYNSRQVSVREERGGLSWCINVTVKDDSVDVDKVKAIAEKPVSIDRCEASGEILSGGNTYVFVMDKNGIMK